MDPLTKKLVQTVRHITENKNTSVPVLGNVNPVTGQPESGVHEYDAQGNKTRSYSGSSASSNTPPQPEPNLPKPAPNASSEPRYTNPEAEQQFRNDLNQRLGIKTNGDSGQPPKPASQEDRLAARFPEAYPEKEVAGQYDKNPETGEYEKTGSAVKDVDPVMTDPNDPKYNEVLDQPSGEEYAEKLRNWVIDRMDPNSTIAKTLRDFGVSSPGDPPDPTEPEENIPASIDNIEDADEYDKEWDRLEGLLHQRGRSKDGGMFYESTGVLSFRGFLLKEQNQPSTPETQKTSYEWGYENWKNLKSDVAVNQKLAKRFPEAYPDQKLVKYTDTEGNPQVLDVKSQATDLVDYGPEEIATRMADWAGTGGDLEQFRKTHAGNPWDTSTVTSKRVTGTPLKEQNQTGFLAGLNILRGPVHQAKTETVQQKLQRLGSLNVNAPAEPMSAQIRPYTKPKEPHLQAQAQADYYNYMLGKYDPMLGARVGGEFSKLEDDLIKANQEEQQAYRDQQTALAAATLPLPWLKGLGIASRVALGIGAPAVATSTVPPPFSTTAQEREEELEKAEEARQAKLRSEKARKQTVDLLKAVEGRTD